jgi:acyl-CoA oxidase
MTLLGRLARGLTASVPRAPLRPLAALSRPLNQIPRLQSTLATGAADDDAEWEAAWLEATESVYDSSRGFEDSAAGLRQLVKTGLLRHTDLRDRPDRFFKAHRLLARHAVKHGPGFWIRFTVHYNLCFGTVLAVGNDEQINSMENVTAEGLLGCFALTERLAGVQSGLIVQTKATYDATSQTFNLTNVGATEGAYKNWISQGFVADKAVVLADLTVDGERKGPHAFLMDMRVDGQLTAGVATGDMGIKTVGNDLDNAWIAFDNVTLPKSALLSRYAQVNEAGTYEQLGALKPFEMIGQRLYTGRVAVAQAALSYRRKLYEDTQACAHATPPRRHTPCPARLLCVRSDGVRAHPRLRSIAPRDAVAIAPRDAVAIAPRDAVAPSPLAIAV